MIKLIYVHHQEVTYASGPVNGPVKPSTADEPATTVELTEPEAEHIMRSGWWDFADEESRAAYESWQAAQAAEAEATEEFDEPGQPNKQRRRKKEAIAKPDVTKEGQSQQAQ